MKRVWPWIWFALGLSYAFFTSDDAAMLCCLILAQLAEWERDA